MCARFLSLLVVLYMSLASQAAPTDPGELTQEPKFDESQLEECEFDGEIEAHTKTAVVKAKAPPKKAPAPKAVRHISSLVIFCFAF
ncbi:hypothetical protein B0H14DRAFT_3865507 [Mycena olivaceomarginata]|nr:hypothetical protein B0H14DRAFT_3865507 [Mycena olivaceomarginata]